MFNKVSLFLVLMSAPCLALLAQMDAQNYLRKQQQLPVTQKLSVPPLDYAQLALEEQQNSGKPVPYKFGENFEYNLEIKGEPYYKDGYTSITIRVESPNAMGLGFIFSEVELKNNAQIIVYNHQDTVVATAANMNDLYTSRPIVGNWANVMLIEHGKFIRSKATIQQVTQVFKNLRGGSFGFGDAGACNINTVCPEGDAFRAEIKAVVMLVINNNSFCSGSLINNTCRDERAYLLTANHCVVDNGGNYNVSTMDVVFNWESPSCSPSLPGPTQQKITGVSLKARAAYSDFTLLELSSVVPDSFGVYYLGWDATGVVPSQTTAIHHPDGDVKKISIDHDAAEDNVEVWRISQWDLGVTEGGSSGSPLLNSNKQIVGQLRGGSSFCGNPFNDAYGKLSASWDHFPQQDQQLKHWLDGCNTGETTLAGLDPDSTIDFCANAQAINCGAVVNGSIGQGISNITEYPCNGNSITLLGTEKVYSFTPDSTGIIAVLITDPNEQALDDLDVFIVASCDSADIDCSSTLGDTAYFEVEAGETYYIVVDAYTQPNTPIPFILSLECDWNYEQDTTATDTSTTTNGLCVSGENLQAQIMAESAIGLEDGSIAITAQAPQGVTFSFVWNTGAFTNAIEDLGTGYYTVTASFSNGCAIIKTMFVALDTSVVDPCIGFSISASATSETSLGANDGTAQVSAFGGTAPYAYNWSSGQNTAQVTGLAPGYYSVLVLDENFCGLVDSVRVFAANDTSCNVMIQSTVTDPSAPLQNDGSILVNVSGGTPPYAYVWNTGSSANPLLGIGEGSYIVTVTDAEFCSKIAFVSVSIDPPNGISGVNNNLNELLIYPNPVPQGMHLTVANIDKKYDKLVVFNALGQFVYAVQTQHQEQVELKEVQFVNGTYIVVATNNAQEIARPTTFIVR